MNERPPVDPLREALHRGVDEPLADTTLNENVRRSRVHAAVDAALASSAAPRPEGLRDRISDALSRLPWHGGEGHETTYIPLDSAIAAMWNVMAAAPRPEGPDEDGLHSAMAGHTITPECGPICWTTGHHHDPEACDGCRRLMDTAFESGAATERLAMAARPAAPRPEGLDALAAFLRYHPDLRGKDGEWVDGWDAATSAILARLSDTDGAS